ncbi:hypothetical protein ACU62C_26440 [Klebsiella aerogenes]
MKPFKITSTLLKAYAGILLFGAGILLCSKYALEKLLLFVVGLIATIGESDMISTADVLYDLFLLLVFSFFVMLCVKGFRSSSDVVLAVRNKD